MSDTRDTLDITAREAQRLEEEDLLASRILRIHGLGDEPYSLDFQRVLLRICKGRYRTGPPAPLTVLDAKRLSLGEFAFRYGRAVQVEAERQYYPWLSVITKDGIVSGPAVEGVRQEGRAAR